MKVSYHSESLKLSEWYFATTILVLFVLRILGPLLWLIIVGGLIYFVFKYLETKKL